MPNENITIEVLADPGITTINEHGYFSIHKRIMSKLNLEGHTTYDALPVRLIRCDARRKGYEGEVGILLYPIEIGPRKR